MDWDYWYDSRESTIEVFVDDEPEYSCLLGPDGEPLKCERLRVGFDLTPKAARGTEQ